MSKAWARAGAMAWARAGAMAGAGAEVCSRAEAWASAGSEVWTWARASLRVRKDWYGICLDADHFTEEGEIMWDKAVVGNCVLIECPSRWYLGIVIRRTTMTVSLAEDGIVCHDLGDTGMFYEGRISESTELTPLKREIEINLGSVDSIQPFPKDLMYKMRKRTHVEQAET